MFLLEQMYGSIVPRKLMYDKKLGMEMSQGKFFPHAAEGFGGDAQVGSDHPLRYAERERRVEFNKIEVPFFRRCAEQHADAVLHKADGIIEHADV